MRGTHTEEEFDEFRDEIELAFPEDTVSYEELLRDDQTAIDGQSKTAIDDHESAEQLPETTDETQQQQDASPESVSPHESADSIVAQLVTEIGDDRASEKAITQLREQLGVTSPENVEVRLRHLQTQVSDLTAYIDALEEFLDRRGSAKHILGSVDRELDTIKARVAALERTHKSDHTHVSERIAEIEERLEGSVHFGALNQAANDWSQFSAV